MAGKAKGTKTKAKIKKTIKWAKFINTPDEFSEKIATRDAYGKELTLMGSENEQIVVLDADLSGSTRTGWFKKEHPERFFNVGIAEQNLIGMSAGFSLGGKIPFASSFAVFLTGRGWEMIRQSICYPKLNVKLVASHSGLTVGEDGASHQCLEDIALMRVLPNMRVFIPADGTQTRHMLRYAAQVDGPVYIRTGRSSIPFIYKKEYKFNPAQADELVSGEDILIISAGVLIKEAMVACQLLAQDNFFPGLLNLHTLKPLDEKKIANYAKKYKAVVTFEEHSVHGGLGAAVAKALSAHTPKLVQCFGMETFGKSGTPAGLLEKFGLDAKAIRKKILQIAKKI